MSMTNTGIDPQQHDTKLAALYWVFDVTWADGIALRTLHERFNRVFPRIGRCEFCARGGPTEYASHEHRYAPWRHDWFELCRPCHMAFDGHLAGRSSARLREQATHCKHGHEWTPENTLSQPGGRMCRECKNRANREYMRRQARNK